jgi:hypothetical protein
MEAVFANEENTQISWTNDQGQVWSVPYPLADGQIPNQVQKWLDEGNAISPYDAPLPTSNDVNSERDRRLKLFTFADKVYDFDADSQQNIAGAYSLALAAVINGAQPNDLRWIDSDQDFAWIAHDNSLVTMDAQTCLAFGQAAASWKADHIRTARSIKDLAPIPIDYAEDSRWPTA